jgi:hypothetical protein
MNDTTSNPPVSERDPGWVDAILDWRWTWPFVGVSGMPGT